MHNKPAVYLENNESSRLPSAQLFQQIIVQHHFSHASVRQTADETNTTNATLIDLEPES